MKQLFIVLALYLNLIAEDTQDINKYLTGTPTTDCVKNITLENYIKTAIGNDGKEKPLFTFILEGADLSSGLLTYNVYNVDQSFETVAEGINKPLDIISFKNPSCNFSDVKEVDYNKIVEENGLTNYSDSKLNAKNNQLNKELQELEDKYLAKDSEFTQVGDKKFLTTASYLVACLTFNEKIIDIKKSLELNKITLKSGYTIYPNNQIDKIKKSTEYTTKTVLGVKFGTGARTVETKYADVTLDSISEYLSDNVILYIFDFRARWNDLLLKIKTFLFLTFLFPAGALLLTSKITKKISKVNDFDDIAEKGLMTIVLLVMFYFTDGTTNKVQGANGKEENINISKFQKFSSNFFDKSMEFANESSNMFSSSYINFKRKSAGYLSEQEIINIIVDTAGSIQQQKKIEVFYDACIRDWDIDKVRSRFEIKTKKEVMSFPSPKQYQTFINGSLVANNIQQFLNENIPYPAISLTGCYKIERDWLELSKTIAKNQEQLQKVSDTQKDGKDREQLMKIAKIQYHTTAEQGFIAIPQVAVTNIVTDSLNMFGSNNKNEKMKAYSDNQIEIDSLNDGWESTQKIFGSLAYMILPGASTIKEFISENFSSFEKIPYFGKHLANMAGTLGSVTIMEKIVNYLPVIALSMASLMVIGWYYISVFIYFLISPFIIVYALSQRQTDTIKDFLIRGVSLAFKPLLIILSVVVAVLAVDLFNDLSIMIYNNNFGLLIDIVKDKTSMANPLDWFFMFLKGLLNVGASIVATLSAFYLVFNGAEMFLGMFGFRDSAVDVKEIVGNAVESKGGKYNTPGV